MAGRVNSLLLDAGVQILNIKSDMEQALQRKDKLARENFISLMQTHLEKIKKIEKNLTVVEKVIKDDFEQV